MVKNQEEELVVVVKFWAIVSQIYNLFSSKESCAILLPGNYDVEDVLEWIQQATNQVTHKLDDSSFEHLTQAATGATTGDWLVAL